MKNVMILGANTLQIPLILKVNEMGYNSVVVSPNPDEPGFEIAAFKVYANVADESAVLKYAKEYDIVGIVTDQTDIAVRTVAYVADMLGLPGIGYDTACLFTDKYLMREKCKELGIKTLSYALVCDVEGAVRFFERINKAVILKPIDNQGSRGVVLASDAKEIKAKFEEAKSFSRSGKVLVEEFVMGREFVVEGLAYNNEFFNLICGDTHYFDIPDVFSATSRIFPSDADSEVINRLKSINKKIIDGFGLKQGISHSEYIMDGDDIILIETAARGGGVFISSDLISLSTGICTEEFLIKAATGTLEKVPEVQEDICACCYVAFYLPVGEVVSVEGIKETIDLPYVYRNNLCDIKEHMRTKQYTDKTARFFAILSASNRDRLSERIKYVKTVLNGIKVKTEKGIETPIWE